MVLFARLWRRELVVLVVTGVLGFAVLPSNANASATSTVSGTVADSGGSPIAGARVIVMSEGRSVSPALNRITGDVVVASVTTSSAGQYSVEIPDVYASYSVEASDPGYVDAEVDSAAPTAAQPTLVLEKAAFSGTVTSINSPAGQTITLQNAASGATVAAAHTDGEGGYAFSASDVSAGEIYVIEASSVGEDADHPLLVAYYEAGEPNGTYDLEAATRLSPTASDRGGLDVAIPQEHQSLFSGTVTDASGPVAGAEVGLVRVVGSGEFGAGLPIAVTSQSGSFELEAEVYPVGSYHLEVVPPVISDDASTYYGNTEDPFGAFVLSNYLITSGGTLDDGPSEINQSGASIILSSAATLAGTFTEPTADAVSGIDVDVAGCSGYYSGLTGADGAYEIPGLRTGVYSVFESSTADNSFQTGLDLSTSGGTVDVIGAAAVSFSDSLTSGGAVSGVVTALSDGVVSAADGVAVDLLSTGGRVLAQTITSTLGNYTFAGIPAGHYDLEFVPSPGSGMDGRFFGGTGTLSRARSVAVTTGETAFANAQLGGNQDPGMAVGSPPSLATPAPVLSGDAQVGKTLEANASSWVCQASLEYQWFADGKAIAGATGSSYVVSAANYRRAVSVQVSGEAPGYVPTISTSIPTGATTIGTLKTAAVTIRGTIQVGRVLVARTGAWTRNTQFAYQWYADKTKLKNATSSTLHLGPGEKGKRITVRVTGKLDGYATRVRTSRPSGAVLAR